MKRFCFIFLLFFLGFSSCVREQPRVIIQKVNVQENPVPGTVDEDWVEPMYDTVKVPGQLDPTGTYYRPAHNTVVEIYHERYREVEYPDTSEDQYKQQRVKRPE